MGGGGRLASLPVRPRSSGFVRRPSPPVSAVRRGQVRYQGAASVTIGPPDTGYRPRTTLPVGVERRSSTSRPGQLGLRLAGTADSDWLGRLIQTGWDRQLRLAGTAGSDWQRRRLRLAGTADSDWLGRLIQTGWDV